MFIYRDISRFPEPGLLTRDPSEFLLQSLNAAQNPLEAYGHEMLASDDFYAQYEARRKATLSVIEPMLEANRTWQQPVEKFWMQGGISFPSAQLEMLHDTVRDYPEPEFNIQLDKETVIPEVVPGSERPFAEMLKFSCGKPDAETVFVLPALSGHYSTLSKKTVQEALDQGRDVVTIRWKNPRDVALEQGDFDLDTYIDYLIDYLDILLTADERLHLIAICQAGTPLTAALAIMAEDEKTIPKSATMIAVPGDTSVNPSYMIDSLEGLPNNYADDYLFHKVPEPYLGAGRMVLPSFMQLGSFIAPNAADHFKAHYPKHLTALMKGDKAQINRHNVFRNEFNAVMDMTRGYISQTCDRNFYEPQLARGTFHHRDRLVRPELLTDMYLMTIEADGDDITKEGQCQANHKIFSGIPDEQRSNVLVFDTGHYGAFNNPKKMCNNGRTNGDNWNDHMKRAA
jgi:poly(3-hydroxybutyrate) depolymerase